MSFSQTTTYPSCIIPLILISETQSSLAFLLFIFYYARVCTDRSTFRFPEVRIGIIPGALGTQLLPRVTSFETALSMCAGCQLLTAKQALKAGIVDQIIPVLPSENVGKGNINQKPTFINRIFGTKTNKSTSNQSSSDGNITDGSSADNVVSTDPNSTDAFTERMILVLENQIMRGEAAPNPYRRTR